MSDLKPCPFCGKLPTLELESSQSWYVHCDNPDCIASPALMSGTKGGAIEAWNTRPSADLTDEERMAWECQSGKGCGLWRENKDCGHGSVLAACVRRLSTLPEAGRGLDIRYSVDGVPHNNQSSNYPPAPADRKEPGR